MIVGRAAIVDRLRHNPLTRALRVDKLTFAALQATLQIHRAGRAFEEIPVLRQLALTETELRSRAVALLERLQAARASSSGVFSVISVASAAGGGSLPDQTLPSWGIGVAHANATQLAARLRCGSPAILPRIQDDTVLIDLRTVAVEDEEAVLERLVGCAAE
jgi:L-seryl-tRNA(Ser) seleniumtransferase